MTVILYIQSNYQDGNILDFGNIRREVVYEDKFKGE